MTLNMKNYKGFDKLPYCGAHVPKAKATTVSDTPEMRRLAENSKIQVRSFHAILTNYSIKTIDTNDTIDLKQRFSTWGTRAGYRGYAKILNLLKVSPFQSFLCIRSDTNDGMGVRKVLKPC
jgi:hypothetical protein